MDRGLCVGERAASVQPHHFSPASLGVGDTEQSNLMSDCKTKPHYTLYTQVSASGCAASGAMSRGAGTRTPDMSAFVGSLCARKLLSWTAWDAFCPPEPSS